MDNVSVQTLEDEAVKAAGSLVRAIKAGVMCFECDHIQKRPSPCEKCGGSCEQLAEEAK